MKRLLLAVLMFVIGLVCMALTGCSTFQGYPMQGGEKIIFHSQERATAYRQWSGNDLSNTGKVVTVTGTAGIKRW